MNSEFLDPELSRASVDENIENFQWKKLTKGKTDDDFEILWDNIKELYWSGLEREMAAAIIAFAEFEEHQPSSLPIEEFRSTDLRTDHLGELIELWNPFDSKTTTGARLGSPDGLRHLEERVQTRVSNELQFLSLEERRAQGLLQSLGLADIDFVREYRRPTFRSLGQRPQIKADEDEYLLEAVQCSNCRHCVRAFHWFECVTGCQDNLRKTNMFSISRPQHGDSDDDAKSSLGQHIHVHVLAESEQKTVPYTLCPPCFEKAPHPYEHLEVVRRFPEGKFFKSKRGEFGLQLDMWEDQMDGRLLMGFGALTLDRFASGASMLSRASTRNIFPAGNSHSSVMFGPLIIENGSRHMPNGAQISLRNIHNFTTLSLKDLQEFISEPSDFVWSGGEDVMTQTHLAVSQDRHVYTSRHASHERRIMSAQKQVAGGLFTLSRPEAANDEREIIAEFIYLSKLWKQKTQEQNGGQIPDLRATLKSYAEHMVARVQTTLGVEIVKYTYCFAKRLHKEVKLKYDRVSNNCQDFSSAMLFNHDEWDAHFAGVFPKLPLRHEQTPETRTFRYMMSFAGRLQHKEYFVSPLTSSLQLYDSFGHNDSDLIDHVINVRTRSWDNESMSSHDVYLMKNSSMTCYEKRGCPVADHLLDGPHDNLSVLTTHAHRKRALYTTPKNDSGEKVFMKLLITQKPSAWIQNRLEILHRLRLLNSYLSILVDEVGALIPDGSLTDKELQRVWSPVSSRLGRCWSCNRRDGRNILKPTWLDDTDTGRMNNARWTLLSTTWHTSPDIQAKEAWQSRYDYLRKKLIAESKGNGASAIIPSGTCDCSSCEKFWASRLCSRATRHAASQGLVPAEERSKAYSPNHPDYVPLSTLLAAINLLGTQYKVVTDFLKQLTRTPEYLGYDQTTELQVKMLPDVYQVYLFKASLHARLQARSREDFPPFLEWLVEMHKQGPE
ncbi:hypothetical protein HJFPF1_04101 [Paramyrothecium foliicola]|nr:hypothetical protein HJFPF1_04101 [Paramyrothecium foliicola]